MHDAAFYIQLLLSGVTVGSLYALIAIGYTMVYGILRLINFAHGDIFMMAGFFMVYISASCSLAVSIPLVLLLTVLLGVAIERAAYKPLRTAPRMSVMISAIGVSYLLQNLANYITGGIARAYPDIPFFTQVMGYPLELVSQEEAEALAESDAVQAMPVFPNKGYCQVVDGIMVIRLSE